MSAPTVDRAALGAAITGLREERGFTRVFLSDLSGVSRRTLDRIEGGQRTTGSDTLRAIAVALRTTPELLHTRAAQLSTQEAP